MRKADFLDRMDRFLGIVLGILAWAFLVVALWVFVGCAKYRYIEVPEIHYRDSVVVRNARDSIYLHDSVYTSLVRQGDTTFATKYVTKYRYKESVRTDTLLFMRADTISVPLPVEKAVYRMYNWQRFFFGVGIAVCVVIPWYIVGWLVRKRR